MEATSAGTDSLFDAIHTQRAIRRFLPDDVPDDLITQVIESATRAPSGSNRQPWGFVVVKDAVTRAEISRALAAYLQQNEGLRSYFERGSTSEDRSKRLMLGGALELAKSMERAPVFLIPCLYPAPAEKTLLAGSSIYPAVQNLLLAARGLGLGTVLTTFQQGIEDTLRPLLGLPDDCYPVTLIPMGFPDAKFGPNNRKPVETVLHWERWGALRTP